jgi:hypothetical protein
MTTTLAAPVTNITLAALTPDVVRSCVVLQPSPPPEPGEEPPGAIGDDDIYTPVAPGVTYAGLPTVTIVDTSPDQLIGCIIDTADNPQGRLNALVPAAIDGDGVIERSTNDIWVYDGSEWNNVGPTPGPTIVTATIIPPWNEILTYEARIRTRLLAQSLAYALQLLTEPDPFAVRTTISVRTVLNIEVPITPIGIAASAPEIQILDSSISTVVMPFEYTGTGTEQSITGLLTPGIVLVRRLDTRGDTLIFDIARGSGKYIIFYSFFDNETTNTQSLTAFNADGFTVGTDALTNASGGTYAGHVFAAPLPPVSDTSGSITTNASVSRAYSILTYTGNGTAGATIGHGLAATPQMVWIRRLNDNGNIHVGGPVVGDNFNMRVPFIDHRESDTSKIRTANSSVVELGNDSGVNASGSSYVAYAFTDVPGVSKLSTYEGDDDPQGKYIDCGFSVDFVLVKSRNRTGGSVLTYWIMFDRTDNTGTRFYDIGGDEPFESFNPMLVFEDRGFRVFGSGVDSIEDFNDSQVTYIYMAFSYIRPTVLPPAANLEVTAEPPAVN